jgi:hypothetical protein
VASLTCTCTRILVAEPTRKRFQEAADAQRSRQGTKLRQMPANGGLPPSHAASLCGPKVHLALGIADLRQWLIARAGGGREDALRPARERSLRRAIKGLVFRGEILASGNGGPGDPRRYTTVECFASATGETVKDTGHAKAIVAEMSDTLSKMSKLGASK